MGSKGAIRGGWRGPLGVVLAALAAGSRVAVLATMALVAADVEVAGGVTLSAAAASGSALVATSTASGPSAHADAAVAAPGATGVALVPASTAGGPAAAAPASATPPASVQDLDRLMALLAQRQHGHVSFVEEHFLAVLDRPVESSGELLYDAPDRLEKRTLKPKPETLILEHGVITAHRGRHTYVLNLSDYPQIVPLIDSIRATLAGDRASLEHFFKVTLDGPLEQWKLLLLPSDSSVAKSVKQIRIEGAQDVIHTVEIQQADGDRSLLTIGPEVSQ